ncbi:hypothetical protein JAAARDRAFT_573057 [Jaapia argillacea MUCL 33604]|uniref:Zn(2)-C6 fungal-type domain-containing protein n=1 Tax=Jaapia argillacea MUCL 33604 TaxID=933084 RepID=A0A067QC95_9AGAM|nr:hypothetical protein JAAARDRAFT_573057 [Jaapia argillacea MUCL 33604]
MDYFRTESPATFPGTYGSKPILPLDARPIHTSPPPTQQNQMRMPAHPQDIYPQYMQSQSAMYHPPQRQRQASAPTGWPGQDPSFMPHHQHQQQSQSQPYHHLLPYLDELISQRRISATATAFPPVSQQYGPQHQGQGRGPNGSFVNVGTSFFCRSPTPAARQRTAQACEKCRERKTKVLPSCTFEPCQPLIFLINSVYRWISMCSVFFSWTRLRIRSLQGGS